MIDKILSYALMIVITLWQHGKEIVLQLDINTLILAGAILIVFSFVVLAFHFIKEAYGKRNKVKHET